MDQSQFSHDDVNDIMSMIMGGHSQQPVLQAEPVYTRQPQVNQVIAAPVYEQPQPVQYESPVSYQEQAPATKRGYGWYYALLILVILGILAVVGFYSRPYLSAMLTPPSPFKDKISQQSFPLFYPTKLPEGYKIEIDSVALQENNIVTYSMSNDRSQRVVFKLQEAPAGLNLAAYEEQYSDYKQVATVNGTAKVGVTTEGNEIAHMMANKTWITVQASKDTLSKEGFATILSSLKIDSPQ